MSIENLLMDMFRDTVPEKVTRLERLVIAVISRPNSTAELKDVVEIAKVIKRAMDATDE